MSVFDFLKQRGHSCDSPPSQFDIQFACFLAKRERIARHNKEHDKNKRREILKQREEFEGAA